jgi:flagellar protein FliT
MTAHAEPFDPYEAIAAASAAMLAAAREGRWDDLVAAERQCAERIARLRALPVRMDLDAPERRRRFDVIHAVLEHDAEIRRLTQPWMATLEAFLAGGAAVRKVSEAYR